jgi:2-hydroxychromene-2-carboxylate isomerase
MTEVTFYFDIGSPYAYLAAERIRTLLPEPVIWQPVLLGGLFKLTGRSSWAVGDYRLRQGGMAEIERRARSYGLPPIRWPDPWPTDYLTAMRAVTYAFTSERGHDLTIRMFRNAFQRGREMSRHAEVLATSVEVGLRRQEVESAIQDPAIKQRLLAATDAAYELGVFGVPTFAVGGELFWGDDRLEAAAAYHRDARAA